MAKINYFSKEIQLSLNHIKSDLFEILGVDKQMFISCGQDEPQRSPKEAYLNCVIGIYFLSFFYDHPVEPEPEPLDECCKYSPIPILQGTDQTNDIFIF